MLQNTNRKKKPDMMLITILSIVCVVGIVLSVLFGGNDNSGSGSQDLPPDGTMNVNKLIISEIMTNNGGTYVNSHNEITDYIELYNGSSRTINLDGYGLSDRVDSIKWAFSNARIEPGQYIVVALTGRLEEGLNAAFRLSAKGGEQLILTNSSGKVIDAAETVSLSKNQTMMRDSNGKWFVSDYGTPGFSNSTEGLDKYYESLKSDEQPEIQINEFLPRNKGNFINKYGLYDGFLEVINVSDHNVDLSQYTIGASHSIPFLYSFDAVNLSPGQIYSVFLGKAADDRTDYTDFSFASKDGVIVLSKNGKILQDIPYTNLPNGKAIIRNPDGSYYTSGVVSKGYPNTADGVDSFQKEYMTMPKGLVINELMNSNDKYLAQNGNQYYDWIELYNNSDSEIDLSEYSLSTSSSALDSYRLPEMKLGKGEYIVFMCSGQTNLSNNSYQHTNFKLGQEEAVYLSRNGMIVDSVFCSNIPYGYSYGRGDYGFYYLETPTPLKQNSAGKRMIAGTPAFSLQAGVYDNVDKLTVSISGGSDIRYTTDGSEPTTSSKKYSEPLEITKTTVLKARCFETGARASTTAVASYIVNENHTVPVISVSLNPSDFSYINSHASTRNLERQAYLELFEDGGVAGAPCSLACFGGNTRFYSKKSYALRFKNEWGAGSFDYQVFKNRDCSSYDALVLRTGSSDWSHAYMRDILGTSLVGDYTDVDVQAYKICVVYFNGQYWGLYNLREKINVHFIEEHYNVSTAGLDLVQIARRVQSGSRAAWDKLRAYARNNSPTTDAFWEYMSSHIDMVNYIDYWIAEMYVANNDIYNCRYFSSPEIEDGKWHHIYYDLDYAWYNIEMNYYTRYLTNPDGIGIGYNYPNEISRNLFKNKHFRELWLERLEYNFHNTWNKEILMERLESIYETLKPEMQRNLSRWKLSASNYEKSVNELRTWIEKRESYIRKQTKSFFGISDERIKQIFGD